MPKAYKKLTRRREVRKLYSYCGTEDRYGVDYENHNGLNQNSCNIKYFTFGKEQNNFMKVTKVLGSNKNFNTRNLFVLKSPSIKRHVKSSTFSLG